MGTISALLKILGAAAPMAKSVIEDVAEIAQDYKKLKAENENLQKQIEVLRKKLFVATIVAVALGLSSIAAVTIMLFN